MRRSAVTLAVSLPLVGLAGALLLAQPRTSPPIEPAVVNTISDFARSHPEWAVLRQDRKDVATVALNHARHMNPDTVGMQDDLTAAQGRVPGVEQLADGRRSLTCASCHQQDDAGRYMEPIAFDRHCRACHETDLPKVGEQRVPHGKMTAIVDHLNRHLLRQQLDRVVGAQALHDPPSAGAWVTLLAAGLVGDSEWMALRPPPRGDGNEAAAPGPAAAPVDVDAALAEARHEALESLKISCMKCHTKDSIQPAPRRPKGEPFEVAAPGIPDRWLHRSVFSHQAHRALTCVECHEQATRGEKTSDIMLPSIDSCRSCHAPAARVRSDCVMCHVYHPPLEPQPEGAITIEEYVGAAGRKGNK